MRKAKENEAVDTSSDVKEEDAKSIKKYDRAVLLMLRECPLALTRPDLPYDRGFVLEERSSVGPRKTLIVTPSNCLTGDTIGMVRGQRPLLSFHPAKPAPPVGLYPSRWESHTVTPSPSSKLSENAATAKDKPAKCLSVDTNITLHTSRIPSEETSESRNCAKTIVDSSSMAAQTDKMKATSKDLIAQVQSTLNNLGSGNVDTLATEIRELPIANIVDLHQVVDMIFRKAVEDPGLSQACATMCKVLTGMQVLAERETCEVQEFVNIRAFLVNRCQAEFGKHKAFWSSRELMLGEISAMQDDKQKSDILSVYLMIEKKLQKTFFTIIGFYGVLFNDRLLTTSLMHLCICHLLLSGVEGSVECLCQLLTTIGKTLESKSGVLGNANDLTEYFTRIAAILQQSEGVSPALRRTIQDLIDLRKRNWVPREDSANSQLGVQLHERSEEARTNTSDAKGIELGSSPKVNEPASTSVSGHDSRVDSTAADVQIKSSQDGCALAATSCALASTSSKGLPACVENVDGACADSSVGGSSSSEVSRKGIHVREAELGVGTPQVPTQVEPVAAGIRHSGLVRKNVDQPEEGCNPSLPPQGSSSGPGQLGGQVQQQSQNQGPQGPTPTSTPPGQDMGKQPPQHLQQGQQMVSQHLPPGTIQVYNVGVPNQSRPAGSQPIYQNQNGPTPRMAGHRGPMVNMPSNHVGQQMFSHPVQMQSMPKMYASQVVPAQLQQQMFVPQGHMPMFPNQPRHQNHTNAAYYTQPGHQQILMTQHPLYATPGYPQQHAPAQPFYYQTASPVGMQRPGAGGPGGPGPKMTQPQPQQVVQGGPPTQQMGQPPVPMAMVSGGPPVVVGSQPSGPQGPPSVSRASSGLRRSFNLHIIDPKTMKSINNEIYVEGSSLPGSQPGSQDSSTRQTPQPESVVDANATSDVAKDFAARIARVANEISAAPASKQFSEVSTPIPRPQSGPPSVARASSGLRRRFALDIVDVKTMKSINNEIYVEGSSLPGSPPGSQVSRARQTPQPESVVDANATSHVAKDFAARIARVANEISAAPASQQFSEVSTPIPQPQSGLPSVARASCGLRRRFALDTVDPKTMKSINNEIYVEGSSLPGSPPESQDSSARQTAQPESDFNTIIEELLSTVTASSLPGLLSKIQALHINSNEMMKQAFNLVFAKAEVCSSARETLAEMLYAMSQMPPPRVAVAGHQTIVFRLQLQLLILNRCIEWFEKNTKRESARDAKLKKINVHSDPVLKNKLYVFCMEEERRIRLEFVGFVEFAVFLYRRQLLSPKVIHRCIRHLLSSGDRVSLLCLCRLLRSIGEDLDKVAVPGTLNATPIEFSAYFDRLKAIASEKSESSDLHAEILDVLQLRRNKWLPTLNPAH